eukprot:gene24350-1628_t
MRSIAAMRDAGKLAALRPRAKVEIVAAFDAAVAAAHEAKRVGTIGKKGRRRALMRAEADKADSLRAIGLDADAADVEPEPALRAQVEEVAPARRGRSASRGRGRSASRGGKARGRKVRRSERAPSRGRAPQPAADDIELPNEYARIDTGGSCKLLPWYSDASGRGFQTKYGDDAAAKWRATCAKARQLLRCEWARPGYLQQLREMAVWYGLQVNGLTAASHFVGALVPLFAEPEDLD